MHAIAKSVLTFVLVLTFFGVFLTARQNSESDVDKELQPDFFIDAERPILEQPIAWLTAAPLASTPLLAGSVEASENGEAARARAALEAALRRDPRSEPALSWRVELAVRRGMFALAVDAIERLIRVNRQNAEDYLELLADVAESRDGAALVLERYATQSEKAAQLLQILMRRDADADLLYGLSLGAPLASRAQFLRSLVAKRDYARAFSSWLSYLPEDELPSLSWPINPDFQKTPSYPPFDWHISANQTEVSAENGLFVVYFGRGRPVFAEQLMPLSPGRYIFRATMGGDAEHDGGRLSWNVVCTDATDSLMHLSFDGVANGETTLEKGFTVPPEGCAFQRLYLAGEPGAYTKPARIMTRRVEIAVTNTFPAL